MGGVLCKIERKWSSHCRAAGAEVTVKAYEQALHGWHTYFPLMHVAEVAVTEMATFLRSKLRGDVEAIPATPAS